MPYPIKTYLPASVRGLYELAKFFVKHRTTIVAVVSIASPGDLAAVNAAMDAVISAANLFQRILQVVDPNAPPHE
jgi:hypothetical protein